MWFPVSLLLLVCVAVATLGNSDPDHAWEAENEYQYVVQSRTVAGLDNSKEQYTGVQLKGLLKIQVKSPQLLRAKLANPQYAHIHETLLDGPESEIPDQQLEYHPIPMSGKPFEIKLKHGVIRDLLVDRDVPTWELNILKSFVSQLQIDTQGENAQKHKGNQVPDNEDSSVMFISMEDSVGGNCEVLYDIIPLSDNLVEEKSKSDRIPFPYLRGNGQHYEVTKVKNYNNCLQRQIYHHGLSDPSPHQYRWQKKKHNIQNEIVSQLSTTSMIISGNLKSFAIQSSETKNQIAVKSNTKSDSVFGTVHSTTRLTLVKKSKGSNSKYEQLNLESTGNLVYTYNNPFSDSENRRERQPSVSINSAQRHSSENFAENSDSSSSSSSSSSEENSGPNSNLQPRAPLRMAPNDPLLPFFVGYKGKSILMSDKVNVESAQNLISEIADEIQNQHGSSRTMLEKFTILKNFLRIMNLEQYAELEDGVLGKNGKQSSVGKQRDVWNVLRDAVAQAGTGPALNTIKKWLQNGKIKGAEAARVIIQIPKFVREATAEYVKAFFEMISNPLVSQQNYLNVSAPLAFAKLIHNSNFDPKLYPIHSFGPMIQKHNNDVVERYIPYLYNQLKQGVHENNNDKVQTYIVAMGLTSHPKIVQYFEPHLEGTKPTSKFHRLLMVAYLYTLAYQSKTQQHLVGPIFYKLYRDQREDHEIRCLAAQQFIMIDPPLIQLQRLAKYTNYDNSEQVNSAVKTMIESVAKTQRPEWQSLANKARSVRYLLNPRRSAGSIGYYKDYENALVQGFTLQTVASDSRLPLFASLNVHTVFDLFQPTVEAGYAVSSIKQLYNEIAMNWQQNDEGAINEPLQKSRAEQLAQILNIKTDQLDNLEGNIYMITPAGALTYPFDSNSLRHTIQKFKNFLWGDYKMELTGFNMNYETTMSFPTESGLPFIYTLEVPSFVKLHAELNEGEKGSSGMKRTGIFNQKVARNTQRRIGFVTPFEHQHYIAGIDDNQMLHIPIEYEVEFNMNQRNLALKIRPDVSQPQTDSQLTLLHYSTVPFTTQQNVLNLQPVSLNRNTHQVLISKIHKSTVGKGPFSIMAENMPLWPGNEDEEENNKENNLADHLSTTLQAWQEHNNNGHYKKLNLLMNAQEARNNEISMNIVYSNMEIDANNNDNDGSHETKNFPALNWPDGQTRRDQILKGLSRGLYSGRVHVVDVSYGIKSQRQYVLSIGAVKSNVDRKYKTYVYWHSQPQENEQKRYEVCYLQEVQYSPKTPLDFEYALKNGPRIDSNGEVYYGNSCQEGTKATLVGKAFRTNQLKEVLENSRIAKQCLKESQEGNKAAPVCQKAVEIAQAMDQYEVSISPPEVVQEAINKLVEVIMRVIAKIKVEKNSGDSKPSVTLKVNVSPYDIVPNVYMRTPQYAVTYPHLMKTILETQQLSTNIDTILGSKVEQDSCTLDQNTVNTFDKRTYPVTLGAIPHVLLTSYPQPNHEGYANLPVEMQVAVLAQDDNGGSRIVTVFMGNQEVKLFRSNNRIQVTVDGQTVEVSKQRSYVNRQGDQIVYEIVMLPDESIKVTSDRYGISVVYDGERVQISASDRYRSAVRGLCGTYDSNPNTDFLTPKNCILAKAEEFAATYALIQDNSQGPVVENRRKAEQAPCKELSSERNYQRNIISDGEAGRMAVENENWGYHHDNRNREHARNNKKHSQGLESRPDYSYQEKRNVVYRTKVVEEGNEICFTTRPIPICVEGTRPVERKSKKYELYCLPRNEESLKMKERIEQGANPDFTRKTTTKSHIFQVPYACNAA